MNYFFESLFCFLFLVRTGEAFAPSLGVLASRSLRITVGMNNQNHSKNRKTLFASSEENDLGEIQSIVGLTDAELKRIVSRVPELNDYSASGARVCAEQLQTRLSLSELEFKKKVVLRLPQALGYDFETDIGPGLSQLQSYLDMSDDELRAVVLKCPQILGLDFATEVEPKIQSIRKSMHEQVGGDGIVDIASLKEEILKKPASLDLAVRGGVSTSKNV